MLTGFADFLKNCEAHVFSDTEATSINYILNCFIKTHFGYSNDVEIAIEF